MQGYNLGKIICCLITSDYKMKTTFKKTLYYKILFDPRCGFRTGPIIKKVQDVLQDNRGWKRMGYNLRMKQDDNNVDFVIYFTFESYIKRKCNFTGLSCADLDNDIIYINENRWRRGSTASKLNLDDYRTYVINHEVGHILGRGHAKCENRNTRVPVMVQQTLGIHNCKPNVWPLRWE